MLTLPQKACSPRALGAGREDHGFLLPGGLDLEARRAEQRARAEAILPREVPAHRLTGFNNSDNTLNLSLGQRKTVWSSGGPILSVEDAAAQADHPLAQEGGVVAEAYGVGAGHGKPAGAGADTPTGSRRTSSALALRLEPRTQCTAAGARVRAQRYAFSALSEDTGSAPLLLCARPAA